MKKVFVSTLFISVSAFAHTFETFGFGTRAEAMSGAQVANSTDFGASFYNPAMLATQKKANVGFNFSYRAMQASVKSSDESKTLDCTFCQSPASTGLNAGFVLPLGPKLQDRVSIGAGVFLPARGVVRVQSVDPMQPFWLNQQSNPERFVLFSGVGVRIFDSLSVGVGIQALANLGGNGSDVTVDVFNKQVKGRSIDATVEHRIAPTAGLFWRVADSVRFGVNYRAAMALDYNIPVSVELVDLAKLEMNVSGTALYAPQTVTLGGAFDLGSQLTVSVDAQWMNWSAAPSPYAKITVDAGGETLKSLGFGDNFDLSTRNHVPGFQDTWNARVGVEYRVSERFAVRGGGQYRPTPVPLQDAVGTNILDGTLVAGSVGVSLGFDDPLGLFERPLFLEFAGQVGNYLERSATKKPGDPVPSYRYSAIPWGATAALRYEF